MSKRFLWQKIFWITLTLLGLALGLRRVRPYFSSSIPLGYDPGIYLAIFQDYSQLLRNFDRSLLGERNKHEPLIWFFAAILWKAWVSNDRLITRGIGIASLLPGIILFFLFYKKNTAWWSLAAILFRISIPQYEAFYRAYFKQILGLSVLLLVLFFLAKKKAILFGFTILILVLLHRHTALFAIVSSLIYLIVQAVREKKMPRKFIMVFGGAAVISLIFYIPLRSKLITDGFPALISTFGGKGYGGIFFSKVEYLKVAAIPLVLSLIGIVLAAIKKSFRPSRIARCIGLLWVVLGLVNYQRTLVFFDLFVVIRAAYALVELIKKIKRIGVTVSVLILIGLWFYYTDYISKHEKQLISLEEFESIRSFQATSEDSIVMNTHKNYTPRIMWYSHRDRISPGRSDTDARTFDQRMQRREGNGKTKCDMLQSTYSDLQRPIYLRIGEHQYTENLAGGRCFERVDYGPTHQIFSINF